LTFRGNYTSFPPEYATPNLAILLTVLKGVEEWNPSTGQGREWKVGRMEEWALGGLGDEESGKTGRLVDWYIGKSVQ
jgi:hypothetical protein